MFWNRSRVELLTHWQIELDHGLETGQQPVINLGVSNGIASHATVIDKGQIVYCDTIEALRNNDAVKSRYLAL